MRHSYDMYPWPSKMFFNVQNMFKYLFKMVGNICSKYVQIFSEMRNYFGKWRNGRLAGGLGHSNFFKICINFSELY